MQRVQRTAARVQERLRLCGRGPIPSTHTTTCATPSSGCRGCGGVGRPLLQAKHLEAPPRRASSSAVSPPTSTAAAESVASRLKSAAVLAPPARRRGAPPADSPSLAGAGRVVACRPCRFCSCARSASRSRSAASSAAVSRAAVRRAASASASATATGRTSTGASAAGASAAPPPSIVGMYGRSARGAAAAAHLSSSSSALCVCAARRAVPPPHRAQSQSLPQYTRSGTIQIAYNTRLTNC
eukprot:scaffold25770_cov67-Phaeocystis_antarctica.AAC.5